MSRSRPIIIIGVCGGSSSGKTSVCEKIMTQISEMTSIDSGRIDLLSLNSFYRELTDKEMKEADKGDYNFDHPIAFDFDAMNDALEKIANGETVKVSNYNVTKRIHESYRVIESNTIDVLLVEGILVFYQKDVREHFTLKLFVDCDSDTRLARRVRSHQALGRPLDYILQVYTTQVKPAFEEFCLPTKKYADVIIPRGADNSVAIDLIVQHIKDVLIGSNGAEYHSPPKRTRLERPLSENNPQYRPH